MSKRTVLVAVLVIAVLGGSRLAAQQVEFPERSTEQRWLRISQLSVAWAVGGIAYAKSLGHTVDDYARYLGELVAPGWSGRKGQGPAGLLQGMHRNITSSEGAICEVVAESETSITARMNRPWIGYYFGDDYQSYGVTVQEYERMLEIVSQEIAEFLDLKWEQRVEGEWIVITISS